MPVTLRNLLRTTSLGLTLSGGSASALVDQPIRWVSTSELVDPTPYLRGGELLLTSGMALPIPDAEVDAYLERLMAASVVGIGFGVGQGMTHLSLPERLRRAADRLDMPVVVVDEATTFVAISEAVAEAHWADQTAELSETLAGHRTLTKAAVKSGPEGVIRQLAALVDGWAFLAVDGHSKHEAPAGAAQNYPAWRDELDRMRSARAVAGAVSTPDGYLSLQIVGSADSGQGVMVTGRAADPTPRFHSMVSVAAALLTLDVAASRPAAGASSVSSEIRDALARYQRRSSVRLDESLRVWLTHNGRIGPAARELGLHRNTLARRIDSASQLLGRDLSDPYVRSQLWMALRRI